jgi:hypothetical protein
VQPVPAPREMPREFDLSISIRRFSATESESRART